MMAKRFCLATFLAVTTFDIAASVCAAPGDYRYMFKQSGPTHHLILNTDAGFISLDADPIANGTTIGNFTNTGYHDYGSIANPNGRYFVGEIHWSDGSISKYRNYLVFDLSSIIGRTIYGAKLRIDNPSGGYASNMNMSSSVTLRIYDIQTDINLLQQSYPNHSAPGTAIYDDLGSGNLFAQRTVSPADNGTQVEIGLNESALAAITTNLGGKIGFGGSLDIKSIPMGSLLGAQIYAGTSNYMGSYAVKFSDNASDWNTAKAEYVPLQAGWNATSWPDAGAHRYWRLLLNNTPGPGSWLNELQMHVTGNVTSIMLSESNLTGYAPRAIVDGSTACCGWHTDLASSGAWLQIDAGMATAFLGIDIYALTQGYSGSYSMQYSDDAVNWNTARSGITPSQQGWNTTSWPDNGAHRYWRLLLENTPGPGAWLNELRMHVAAPLTSSMLSQSELSGYNQSTIVDGSTACCGWHTDSASEGAWLQIDTAGTAVIDGLPTSTRLNTSQIGHFTFNGTAGQRLGIGVTRLTMSPSQNEGWLSVKLYKPDGSLMNSFSPAGAVGGGVQNLGPLPATGTYTLRTDPGLSEAEFDLLLSTAVNGTLLVNTGPYIFNTTRVGQFARYGFSGTAGQSYVLQLTQNYATAFPDSNTIDVFVNKPDGTMLKPKASFSGTNGLTDFLGNLPVTGTYYVLIRPGSQLRPYAENNQIKVKLLR